MGTESRLVIDFEMAARERIIVLATTLAHGTIECVCAIDEAGNRRLVPMGGADLDDWRANPNLVPPWLLPGDLADGGSISGPFEIAPEP